MAREVAAIERIDRDAAIAMLNKSLVKVAPAAPADADAAAAA
jgi:CarD family transcriptional regulator